MSEEAKDGSQPDREKSGKEAAEIESPKPAAASGRLMLCNPGTPKEPLPDDIDLEELLACIEPGGHVTVHEQPGGPMVSAIIPYDDPRMKFFEAGVKQGRKDIATQVARAGVSQGGVQNRFEHVEHATFNFG